MIVVKVDGNVSNEGRAHLIETESLIRHVNLREVKAGAELVGRISVREIRSALQQASAVRPVGWIGIRAVKEVPL